MTWMRFGGGVAAGLAVLATAEISTAQQRPDFTGVWAPVAAPAEGTPQPAVMGQQFSFAQSSEAVTIVRTIGTGRVTMRVPLDGSEAKVRTPPRRLCDGDSVSIYTAGWEGATLRLTLLGVVPPGGGETLKRDSRYTFEMSGTDTLTVRLQNITAGQAQPRTFTTAYKRTSTAPETPAPAPPAPKAEAGIAQLAWLTGLWVGTRGADTIEERWTSAASGTMLALSRTLRGALMNEFEFLCIVERNGGLVYTAMPNGRQPPTEFVLTKIDADGATFENPSHDFPKMIRYAKGSDGTLQATISGDASQKPITFVYKKQE